MDVRDRLTGRDQSAGSLSESCSARVGSMFAFSAEHFKPVLLHSCSILNCCHDALVLLLEARVEAFFKSLVGLPSWGFPWGYIRDAPAQPQASEQGLRVDQATGANVARPCMAEDPRSPLGSAIPASTARTQSFVVATAAKLECTSTSKVSCSCCALT